MGLLLLLFACAMVAARQYEGWDVVEVPLGAELERLGDVDVWRRSNGTAEVLLPPGRSDSYRVVHRNVSQAILAERARLDVRTRFVRGTAPASFFDEYRDVDEYSAFIEELRAQFPSLVEIRQVGQTDEGRVIRSLVLGAHRGKSLPAILISGLIHAREWLGGMTTAYIAQTLLEDAERDPSSPARRILEEAEVHIVVPVNVDGFAFSWASDRLWRKTRTVNAGSTCRGVDPNRNFPFQWGASGISRNPCSEIFLGARPLQPGCVVALDRLQSELKGRAILFLDVHAYFPSWTCVWGYTTSLPADYNVVNGYAQLAATAVEKVNGMRFTTGSAGRAIGLAAGGTDDNIYAMGVPASFTVEVRGRSFVEPVSQILLSGREVYAGFVALAQELLNERNK